MRMVVLPPNWNPFQTFLMGAAVAGGLSGLVAKDLTSKIAEDTLPIVVLYIWYVFITLGGILVLVGMHINFRHRLEVKVLGLGLLGCIGSAYTILIAIAGDRPFAYPVLITGAFSLACLTRLAQIIKILRKPDKSQEVIT